MKWQLLGPLQLTEPWDRLSVTPKARTVLGLLLCRANTVVPMSALITESWDGRPPRSARTTIQTYVLHLRRALASALSATPEQVSGELLTTHPNGYRLAVEPGALDTAEFARLTADGMLARDAGRVAEAASLLTAALRLWSGPALLDVPCGPVLEAECARLTQMQLSVEERMLALKLDLGRCQEVLGDVVVLSKHHPTNENLAGLLMLALHRSGRRTDAMSAFHELRTRLVDELAIEPRSALQELYRALITSDPVVDEPGAAAMLLPT